MGFVEPKSQVDYFGAYQIDGNVRERSWLASLGHCFLFSSLKALRRQYCGYTPGLSANLRADLRRHRDRWASVKCLSVYCCTAWVFASFFILCLKCGIRALPFSLLQLLLWPCLVWQLRKKSTEGLQFNGITPNPQANDLSPLNIKYLWCIVRCKH